MVSTLNGASGYETAARAPERRALFDLRRRITLLEQEPGQIFSGQWRWVANDSTPLTGKASSNYPGSGDISTLTELYLNRMSDIGRDALPLLMQLQNEDRWVIADPNHPDSSIRGVVNGTPVDHGTYWTIPVKNVTASAGVQAPSNNTIVTVGFQSGGGMGQPGPPGPPGEVPAARTISTTLPLTGGGDLSTNRVLGVNNFTATTRGTVPPSGGGVDNYLRADGSWTTPPGGGGTGNANIVAVPYEEWPPATWLPDTLYLRLAPE